MSTQYTSPYSLPYPQSGDPVREGAAIMEELALRVNQVLVDGTFPSSNPDIFDITTRLDALEAATLSTAWTKLTNLNAWVDYVGGGGYRLGLWYRKHMGNLQINGMVKSGAANTVMATLPAGSIPAKTVIRSVHTAAGLGQVLVDALTGNIHYMTGSPGAPTYCNVDLTIPLT